MKIKKSTIFKITLFSFLLLGINACKTDRDDDWDDGNPSKILEDSYTIDRFKVLTITPNIKNGGRMDWIVTLTKNIDNKPVAYDSVIAYNTSVLDFISPNATTFPLKLKTEYNGIINTYTSKIIINKEAKPYSKYISNVFDFRPAVGQFINEIPEYATGNNAGDMVVKARQSLVGSNSTMVSLGGYGGYVVFGFDHTIPNLAGRDFKILGNAFWANQANQSRTGNCEPGIILVAYDKNKNGKPDEDEWYEIAGSEYFKNTTIKNYSITYYKPDESKPAVPGTMPWQLNTQYVQWQDNKGKSGYKTKNSYHKQSYYPLWISEASYGFTGTKLADNYYDQNGAGNYWVGRSYDFGYADNAPNNDDASNIDISWAVDKNGNYVKLPGIDFVKVYTGINQEAGWLGEVSTEVAGAYDLYLK